MAGNIIGFETGDLSQAVSTVGTVSVQTAVVRSGTYALRVNPTTTAVGNYNIGDATTGANFADANSYCAFYFKWLTKPASGSEEIFASTDGTTPLYIRLNSNATLSMYKVTTLLGTGAAVLTTGTWYLIEVRRSQGTAGVWEFKVNGAVQFSTTQNVNTAVTSAVLGKIGNRNSQTVDFYYDDFAMDNTGYPGPGECLALRPNADGALTANWAAFGDVSKWQCVDEFPNDGDTTYATTSTASAAYTAALANSAAAGISGTIWGVNAYACYKNASGTDTSGLRVRSGVTNSDNTLAAPGTAYVHKFRLLRTDPATGLAWTTSGLDSAEVGLVCGTGTSERRLTSVALFVYFNPPSGVNYSDTGVGGLAGTSGGIPTSASATAAAGGAVTTQAGSPSLGANTAAAGGVTPGGAGGVRLGGVTSANGGLVVGQSGSAVLRTNLSAQGGATFAGAGTLIYAAVATGSSGVTLGGVGVPVTYTNYYDQGNGGAVFASAGFVVQAMTDVGAGRFVVGSAGVPRLTLADVGQGGGTLTGSGSPAAAVNAATSGRLTVAGNGVPVSGAITTASGTLTLQGTGTPSQSYSNAGVGALTTLGVGYVSAGIFYYDLGTQGIAIVSSGAPLLAAVVATAGRFSVADAGTPFTAAVTAGSGTLATQGSGVVSRAVADAGSGGAVTTASGAAVTRAVVLGTQGLTVASTGTPATSAAVTTDGQLSIGGGGVPFTTVVLATVGTVTTQSQGGVSAAFSFAGVGGTVISGGGTLAGFKSYTEIGVGGLTAFADPAVILAAIESGGPAAEVSGTGVVLFEGMVVGGGGLSVGGTGTITILGAWQLAVPPITLAAPVRGALAPVTPTRTTMAFSPRNRTLGLGA